MIAILSCVWQRLERLEHTLAMLNAQTLSIFDVYLINNNYAARHKVDAIAHNFEVIHNKENRGPFARIEIAHELHNRYDYFMTLDDDLDFDKTLVAQWWNQRDEAPLQGWNGFNFHPGGTYWQRDEVLPGRACHYVWGSNMLAHSDVFYHDSVMNLPEKYQLACDDLWLCYHTLHELSLPVRKGVVHGNETVHDGKDTYIKSHGLKTQCLNDLRQRGWLV